MRRSTLRSICRNDGQPRAHQTLSAKQQFIRTVYRAPASVDIAVPRDDIRIVANNSDNWYQADTASETGEDAATGAGLGAVVGGAGGPLAGLGIMASPGIGPVVAAGWLAATAVGAVGGAAVGGAAGGIVGALTESRVSERDADTYAEGISLAGLGQRDNLRLGTRGKLQALPVTEADRALFGARSRGRTRVPISPDFPMRPASDIKQHWRRDISGGLKCADYCKRSCIPYARGIRARRSTSIFCSLPL